jgi:glycosyltransferase involved in cell wall biosynthesis
MKEVIRHKQDGLVVPVDDVDALAEAIRQLHADRRLTAQLAASARQREADSFTPEKMAERCVVSYRGVLGEQRVLKAA